MAQLPTIEVYIDGVDSTVIINEADFDPNIHRKDPPEPKSQEPNQQSALQKSKSTKRTPPQNDSKEQKKSEQPTQPAE